MTIRPNWHELVLVAMFVALFGLLLLMCGCGATRDAQSKTVEKLDTLTGPIVARTPFGDITVEPVRHQMARSERTVETSKTGIDFPEGAQMVAAVAGGTPWGGIISGIVGLGVAAFAGKKAIDAGNRTKRLVKASSEFADDLECAETDLDVAAVKAKHAAKQKALGIYDDLTKVRHA